MPKFDGMDPELVRQLLAEVQRAAVLMRTTEGRVTRLMSAAGVPSQVIHRPVRIADACDEMVTDVSARLRTLERKEKQTPSTPPDVPKNTPAPTPAPKDDPLRTGDDVVPDGERRMSPPADEKDQPSKADKDDRPRPEKDAPSKPEKDDTPRNDKPDAPPKPEKDDKPDAPPKAEKDDKPDAPPKAEKDDKPDAPPKAEKDDKPDAPPKAERDDPPRDDKPDVPRDEREGDCPSDGQDRIDTPREDHPDDTGTSGIGQPRIVEVDGVKVIQVPVDAPTMEEIRDLVENLERAQPMDMPVVVLEERGPDTLPDSRDGRSDGDIERIRVEPPSMDDRYSAQPPSTGDERYPTSPPSTGEDRYPTGPPASPCPDDQLPRPMPPATETLPTSPPADGVDTPQQPRTSGPDVVAPTPPPGLDADVRQPTDPPSTGDDRLGDRQGDGSDNRSEGRSDDRSGDRSGDRSDSRSDDRSGDRSDNRSDDRSVRPSDPEPLDPPRTSGPDVVAPTPPPGLDADGQQGTRAPYGEDAPAPRGEIGTAVSGGEVVTAEARPPDMDELGAVMQNAREIDPLEMPSVSVPEGERWGSGAWAPEDIRPDGPPGEEDPQNPLRPIPPPGS